MAKVTEILSAMPHISMVDKEGNGRVIPLLVFQRIAAQQMPVTALEDWEVIVPAIINEWLLNVVLGDGKAI